MDVGCVQKDFVRIDTEETLRRLESFYADPSGRLSAEMRWLEEHGIDLVLSDVPSYPLQAAKRLGIPALLVANFTWHDIYSAMPGIGNRAGLLEILREEYTCATLQFLPQCHIDNSVVARKQTVGFIGLKGRDAREELAGFLPAPIEDRTLVFIYLGQSDSSRIEWSALKNMRDCVFVTRDPIAQPSPSPNLFVLDGRFSYPDLIASSDVVCTKAGYSTLATAFAHGKPAISCDREGFCEFGAVRDFMERNEVGLIVDSGKFYSCDWSQAVKRARKLTVKGKTRLDGELDVVAEVRRLLQN
ncbi:MAG: hypothetical protein HY580_06605 [Nitrospinae bacterium]|nr:hypothetical protein [Nitrospinota bacterium]